jgi:hypothetical protein
MMEHSHAKIHDAARRALLEQRDGHLRWRLWWCGAGTSRRTVRCAALVGVVRDRAEIQAPGLRARPHAHAGLKVGVGLQLALERLAEIEQHTLLAVDVFDLQCTPCLAVSGHWGLNGVGGRALCVPSTCWTSSVPCMIAWSKSSIEMNQSHPASCVHREAAAMAMGAAWGLGGWACGRVTLPWRDVERTLGSRRSVVVGSSCRGLPQTPMGGGGSHAGRSWARRVTVNRLLAQARSCV